MTTVTESRPVGSAADRPGEIRAVPVRHPGRWVAIAIIVVLTGMLVHLLVTNDAFDWHFVFQSMNQRPVINGFLKGTLLVTALSMLVGVVGGIILAVMRLSDNPILSGVSWVFTWFFRSVPRYILLFTMGTLGILFQQGISLGVPFDWKIMDWLGLSGDWRFANLDANQIFTGIIAGVIGLGLSEAAYMAEIARAGILSVDKGQAEAAQAQAMRVIVQPTGNETIAMLKDTSLLLAVPVISETFYQLQSIGSTYYKTFPIAVAATLYYLGATSVLMVGQYFLERHFGRGFGTRAPRPARPAGVPAGVGGV